MTFASCKVVNIKYRHLSVSYKPGKLPGANWLGITTSRNNPVYASPHTGVMKYKPLGCIPITARSDCLSSIPEPTRSGF